ncbi:MAG: hypothetical protein SFV21_12110, partial [Rhodospirillaceae bacterium]|nr:hypothetical protein [Rhodospirillaceae bacterium]
SRSLEEGGAAMTFWSHGRRATRAQDEPAPTGPSVMIIGGSNAQSYGVPDADTFAFLLGRRFPDARFENFGTGGYSTVQASLLAARALGSFYGARKPNLILLGFDDSHVARNVADQSWVFSISDPEGRYVAPPHFRINDGAAVFHPFRTIGFWPLEKQSAAVTVLHNVWLQSFAYNTAQQGPAVTRDTIDGLRKIAANEGIDFAVAVLEDRSQVTPGLLDGLNVPVIDCSAPGRERPAEFLLDGGSHPNARLHAFFADCLTPFLDAYIGNRSARGTP